LEVAVGTGRNLPYYPRSCRITAVDLSPAMLALARARAQKRELDVDRRR
jgi:ubiquinone/menaquinone biosynthesis C-methylase UbiE